MGIVSTLVVFCFGSVGMTSHISSAVAVFNNAFKYNNIVNMLFLCATFAASANFCIDLQTRFALPLLIRSGRSSYAISKCISAAIAGGLTVSIGAAIFIIYTCVAQPSMLPDPNAITFEFANQAFGDLLAKRQTALFFACYLYVIFMQAAFFSSLGMLMSCYLPNKYVAYISPFALSFMLNQVANVCKMPIWLDPVKLATARIFGVPTSTTLCMVTGLFLSLTILCDVLFVRRAKRRMANG